MNNKRKTFSVLIFSVVSVNILCAQVLVKSSKGLTGTNQINFNYEYNEKKSIFKLESNFPQIFKYLYFKDSILQIIETDTTIIKLKDGLAYYFYGKTDNQKTEKLKFNESGYLINKQVKTDYGSYFYSTESNYEYKDGNLIKLTEKQLNKSGDGSMYNHVNTTIYEYYPDKANGFGNNNFGEQYLGKSSKNLLKSLSANGRKSDYKYEFNINGTVKKRTILSNGKVEEATSFEYY